jgi:hypothetical protein
MENYIEIDFTDTHEVRTSPLYQYDYGQEVRIKGVEEVTEVHFWQENLNEAIRVSPTGGAFFSAAIPDRLLKQSKPITVYVYVSESEKGKTTHKATIPVIARPQLAENIE